MKKKIDSRKFGLVGVSALAIMLSSPLAAQDADAPAAEEEEEAPAEGGITVTGSRIQSVTPFNSPDPIIVIDPSIAAKEGKLDLASTLQSSPISAGSTQITSALSSNFVTNGGPGAQTVDLRGLGPNRTLVLLNGRRAGPAGTRGGVSSFDLNVLPIELAKEVAILKTGASSVYGSDAVAGVVNIITKNDFDGFQLSGNVSAPLGGGGNEYRINAIFGKKFDRGHIMFAADYTHIDELARGDREYLACPEAYTFRQDGSRADIIDPRTGQFKCEDLRWGHVWTYNRIGNMRLDGPGGPNTGVNTSNGRSDAAGLLGRATVLMQYQYTNGPGAGALGIPAFGPRVGANDFEAPAGWFPTGYSTAALAVQNSYHPFVEEQSIIPETDLYTFYAEGSYEVTDSVELFGEFLANRRTSYQNGWRQFWNFGGTSDVFGTLWADGWFGNNFLSPTGITNQNDSSQKVDYYRGVGGLRGDFGGTSDWKWEIYGQYSKSNGIYRQQQILQDAYNTGYFQTSSCVGTVTPISGRQCIDIPWNDPLFLRGELTPAQIGFLFDWESGKTVYTQLSAEATVTGTIFELPAGPLSIAAGVTGRRDKINDTPGEITLAGNAWGTTTSGITAGKGVTMEAFGELNAPILADKPFFKELTLSLAGRVTNAKATRANPLPAPGINTDSDNGNFTYKVGLNWAVNDWLRFRGSYGTSFRAPALFEQFLADETSSLAQTRLDPCINWGNALATAQITQRVADNCAADGIPNNHGGGGVSANITAKGGLGLLNSETSKAMVVGMVLTPKFGFLPDTRINIAVDYFDIKVKDEITQLGGANILLGCYQSETFATEPLCDLFTRGQFGAPFNINNINDQFVNIATQRNSGIDVAVRINQDLGSAGSLSFIADMTWQLKDNTRLFPTSELESDNGESGSPKWVGDFRLSWDLPGGTSLFYGVNVIGKTSNEADFIEDNGVNGLCIVPSAVAAVIRGTYCPDLKTPMTFYHNASITQEINDRFDITLGMNNIFDTRPPRVSVLNGSQITTLGPVAYASQYSFQGRRVFLSARAKF